MISPYCSILLSSSFIAPSNHPIGLVHSESKPTTAQIQNLPKPSAKANHSTAQIQNLAKPLKCRNQLRNGSSHEAQPLNAKGAQASPQFPQCSYISLTHIHLPTLIQIAALPQSVNFWRRKLEKKNLRAQI